MQQYKKSLHKKNSNFLHQKPKVSNALILPNLSYKEEKNSFSKNSLLETHHSIKTTSAIWPEIEQ